LLPHLQRVREAAQHDKRARFTALLHHVDAAALARAFRRLKRNASAGVDGETVATYEQHVERNLHALCERVHTGRYRPLPVRRVFISKADGGRVKLKTLNEEAKRRRHTPVRDQHRWLCQVLRGHYAYFGLPSNFRALQAFAYHVRRIWFRALYRRSQRRLTGAAFDALLARFPLPKPRITHPCLA
jgi:hypothetical protein